MSEQGVQRRDELHATALKLFAEQGFQATSVREIADAMKLQAGVCIPTSKRKRTCCGRFSWPALIVSFTRSTPSSTRTW